MVKNFKPIAINKQQQIEHQFKPSGIFLATNKTTFTVSYPVYPNNKKKDRYF